MTHFQETKRRVLFCTLGYEPGPVGGAERQARLQAEELAKRGWRVDVVTARDPGTHSGSVGAVFVRRLPRINRRPLRTLTYLAVLFSWLVLNVRRYDVVHVHLANLQADIAAIVCRFFRVGLYVKLAAGGPRGEIARTRPVSWLTRYVGIRWAARTQATSNEIVGDLRRIGVQEERIVRIPNGLDFNGFEVPSPEERAKLRRDLQLPADHVLILYAGRFAGYKGVVDLLRAWEGVKPARPSTLVLVGGPAIDDPVEVPETRDTVVVPWSDRIGAYFRASDVYAHPSHADGMPNAVLEAMSSGLAVVATRVAAVPEMISHRETGLLVRIGDIPELTSRIAELIADEELRARLGRAAATEARRTYPIATVVDRIEVAYQAMLTERGP
jgi:glycosyltransferase involved in cell wall biosynthesis